MREFDRIERSFHGLEWVVSHVRVTAVNMRAHLCTAKEWVKECANVCLGVVFGGGVEGVDCVCGMVPLGRAPGAASTCGRAYPGRRTSVISDGHVMWGEGGSCVGALP